jgi:hypothetical protein
MYDGSADSVAPAKRHESRRAGRAVVNDAVRNGQLLAALRGALRARQAVPPEFIQAAQNTYRPARLHRTGRTVGLVYDHDPEEVEVLGWEEFIARQWESIFVGYRSTAGLRKMSRRWSDLIEIGLGCSQDIADLLVRAEIIERIDHDLLGTADAQEVVSGMVGVIADLRADLLEMGEVGPGQPARLLEQHARLLAFIRAYAFGQDTGEPRASQ